MKASTSPSGRPSPPPAEPARGSGTRVQPTTETRWLVVALGLYSAMACVPLCESSRRVASMPHEMGPLAMTSAFIAAAPRSRPCSVTSSLR
jgi:hypothetical protein